jgi:hypothetical protein
LAKQIITLYHAAQKPITKDQHALVLPLLHLAKIPLDDSLFLFFWPSSIGFMALGAGPNPSGVIISIWLTLITANMFTYFIVTLLGYYLYKLVGKK